MIPRRPTEWWVVLLKPWPLLIASVVAITAGVLLLKSSERADDVGEGLVLVGAMLLGGWMALMAAHGYPGDDDQERQ